MIKLKLKNLDFYKLGIKLKMSSFKRNNRTRLKLYKKIASLVRQDMSIKDIVDELINAKKSGTRKDKRSVELVFLEYVKVGMTKGKSFSDSLVGWVTNNEHQLIAAGEKSGDLENAFSMASNLTERVADTQKRVRGTLIIPSFLLIGSVGIMSFLSRKIMPALTQLLPIERWPAEARFFNSVTSFVDSYIFVILGFMVVTIFVIFRSFSRLTGPARDILDKFPLFVAYRDIQSSIFLISLSTLLNAQISLKDSILAIKRGSNKYIDYKLTEMIANIEKGMSPGKSINTSFFGETGSDIEIYSKASNFEEALYALGQENMDEKVEKIEGSFAALKYGLMFFVAGIIMFTFITFFGVSGEVGSMGSMGG